MAHNLVAFDFDHTIVDDNTDTSVASLIDKSKIPNEVKNEYRKDGWTKYMEGIFKVLHKNGIDENSINNCIKRLPPVPGMLELIKEAHENLNYDVIIISDSNTYFINVWLKEHNIDKLVTKVYSNPAKFQNGLLEIRMYHFQKECKLSSKNLCKGRILDDFIKSREKQGITYRKVVYCGDGSNDFCPILKLASGDTACVRKDYRCAEIIKNVQDGKEIENIRYELKADVCVWENGFDILNFIKLKMQTLDPSPFTLD